VYTESVLQTCSTHLQQPEKKAVLTFLKKCIRIQKKATI